jgi:hypothetical protein
MGKIRIENFLIPSRLKTNFLCPLLIKVETSLPPPPPVWIGKFTAMKQVCVAGKVRY